MIKKLLCFINLFFCLFLFSSCYKTMTYIDKLSVIVGIGHDANDDKINPFSSSTEILTFKGNKEIDSKVIETSGSGLYDIVNRRQSKNSKKSLYAIELSYIIGEKRATNGIEDILNTILKNDLRNEKSFIAVTEGTAKDLLSIESKEAMSMSEELRGLIESMHFSNFFSNNYEIIDMLKFYNSKGRQIVIPYIKVLNSAPCIDGLAIFEGDKLKFHTNLKESKYINILRNPKCQGYLTFKDTLNMKYAETRCLSKCKTYIKKDTSGNLIYDISITVAGDLLINSTQYSAEELEPLFAKDLKTELESELNKIKYTYKIDCLDFGRKAYSLLGDEKFFDVSYFLNSTVNLKVDFKIKSPGRTFD